MSEDVDIVEFKQHGEATCGHVCLSMITGIPPQDIVDRFGHAEEGMTKRKMVDALKELGIEHVVHRFNCIFSGKVYILTVPSLNIRGVIIMLF